MLKGLRTQKNLKRLKNSMIYKRDAQTIVMIHIQTQYTMILLSSFLFFILFIYCVCM